MNQWTVRLIGFGSESGDLHRTAQQLQDVWRAGETSRCTAQVADAADAADEGVDAAALVPAPDIDPKAVLALLSDFEERTIPTIVLSDAAGQTRQLFQAGGAIVLPRSAEPAVIAATLHGLLHRQREVAHLHREIAIARRSQGGLHGEISRMHDELQLAAMVQREYLPREMPSVHNVNFSVLWRPAHYVAGDIYDVERLDEDHVGFFVADAVGHGVPAALMTMVICRSVVMKQIVDSAYRIVQPSQVLARMNEHLLAQNGQSSRFATAVYGLINCRTRIVTIAGAGHPPPIHQTASGEFTPLATTGGLLGVFENEEYEQIEVELGVNDRLLLYSDGFEQAFPELDGDAGPQAHRFPTARYIEEFRALSAKSSATDMTDTIAARLDGEAGSLHQIDDLTLLCLHAGPLLQDPEHSEQRQPRLATH